MNRVCTRSDHPAKPHGHYGFGGAHWCSDFASPLLSEGNMGVIEQGQIVKYEKVAPLNDNHDPLCLFARQSEAMGVQTPRPADECISCRQSQIARRVILTDLRTQVEALRSQVVGREYMYALEDFLALIDEAQQ